MLQYLNVLCIFPKAFRDCAHLTQLTTKNGTKIDITDSGVRKNNNVTFIDVKTTSNITSVTIPDGVTEIPDSAFWKYDSLTNITIPDSVTNIGNNAFENCTSLKSITIPDRVTTIGGRAFFNCTSLTSVNIGENSKLESIGNQAFENCGYSNNTANLTLNIPDSVTSIGSNAFYNLAEITYDPTKMTATIGYPWGAKKVNGVEQ